MACGRRHESSHGLRRRMARTCNHGMGWLWTVVLCLTCLVAKGLSMESCSQVFCQNGGTCVQRSTPSVASYCQCTPYYTGQLCEQEILCSLASSPALGSVTYSRPPKNVSGVGQQYQFGTTASYQCRAGRAVPAHNVQSVCSSNSNWDPSPPSVCHFVCNTTSCPSFEDKNPYYTGCCSLRDRPIGCCRNGTRKLLEDRFQGVDGQCALDLFNLLVPCEKRLSQCYESLASYNYSCPDLHGCDSRITDPETSVSSLVCPPIAGPGAELCDSSCQGFYCLQKESYCLPRSCINPQSLQQIAISETNMNCDLEKLFLGVSTCSGTTVSVMCYAGAQGSASTVFGNCTAATCPASINPKRTDCCQLGGQPVGCCSPGVAQLLANRFRFISGQCSANIVQQLQPCGHRLVQCLGSPQTFNFTCPDSHGCLVSQEDPTHCQRFVGPGAKWCQSSRCSQAGCVSTSFCMASSCQLLEQRYSMARSDALLKCDSDALFSNKKCAFANSTITCDGDTMAVTAATADACVDELSDFPSQHCSAQQKTCCRVGKVSLGCCNMLTQTTLSEIFPIVSQPACKSQLLTMVGQSGNRIISLLESKASTLTALPTFGPSTNVTATPDSCATWLGKGALYCKITFRTSLSSPPSLSLSICLPPACTDQVSITETVLSERQLRCQLQMQGDCPLLGADIECKDSNSTTLRYTNVGAQESSSDLTAILAGAIGGFVGLLLIILIGSLLHWRSRRSGKETANDKIELTNS